ncbi:MAG: hypothetical protein GY925_06150 [Actinomycetia bacterium]|nr:hypothetical protein [Actinomycetes bacterium]
MIIAAWRDTPYNIVLLLHILTAIMGIAPVFVNTLLAEQMTDHRARAPMIGFMARNNMRIYGTGLIVAGLIGLGLPSMSKTGDEALYAMSDSWVAIGFVVWILMVGVMHGLIVPAEKAVSVGDDTAEKKLTVGSGVFTLLAVVELILMVVKPGA